MLKSLSIKNLALIKSEEIEFHDGLNILLGETGSGKSLIFDAIMFVTNQKSDKTLLRNGEQSMKVDALFSSLSDTTVDILKSYDLDTDELLISRTLQSDGKTNFRVNGEIVTGAMVKTLAKTLLDFMVQHESVEILKTKNHLLMLDKFGGKEIEDLKSELSKLFQEKKDIETKIELLGGIDETRQRTIELLSYQINEIERANLVLGEEEEIKEKMQLMDNAEKIVELSVLADKNLNSSVSARSLVTEVISNLNGLPQNDVLMQCQDRLISVRYEIEDIGQTLGDLKNSAIYDEIEYERLDSRLDTIKDLKKKYGKTLEEIFGYLNDVKERYNNLIDGDQAIISLTNELKKLNDNISVVANKLSLKRKEIALVIEKRVVEELKSLGMKQTTFKVNFEDKNVVLDGKDSVEFVFSANQGQDVKNLAKTASGGEASRIMLAIKNIFSSIDEVGTLVFDEVDSGISGEVGNMVADKLVSISKNTQILCITHLPQLAALADSFYLVKKEIKDSNTFSNTSEIDEDVAITEIARLIGGNDITDTGLNHAKELRKRKTN